MNSRVKYMLTITLTAILLIFVVGLMTQLRVVSEEWAVRAAPSVSGGGSEGWCRALFTVTAPAGLHAHNWTPAGAPHSPSNASRAAHGWRRPQPHQLADRGVRLVVQHRSSPSGASTADYRRLAALLPPLLTWGHHHAHTPSVVATSRIAAAGGLLPFVPCAIVPYHQPASVTHCFATRIAAKGALSIHFMGDSKIRELFYIFLRETDDAFHYEINFLVCK